MTSSHRKALIAFGAVFVVLFAWVVVTEGFGKPSVPSGDVAIVEDVPDGAGNITREEFDKSFRQASLAAGLEEPPEPGSEQYEAVVDQVTGLLIQQAWIVGEAAEQGISASEREVENQLAAIKDTQFSGDKAYREFLKESGLTEEQFLEQQVRPQVLGTKIQEEVEAAAPKPTDREIEDVYEAQIEAGQYTTPARNEIRLIVTSKAKDTKAVEAALAKDDSDKSFARLARKYSTNPSKSDGGRTTATAGQFPDPAGSAIMGAAEGDVQGPIDAEGNDYFFRVIEVTPEEVQPLSDQLREEIVEQQLAPALERQALDGFVEDWTSKWTSRTVCDEGLIRGSVQAWEEGLENLATTDPVSTPPQWLSLCSNFSGTGIPEGTSWACVDSGAFSEQEAEAAEQKAEEAELVAEGAEEAANLACPAPINLRPTFEPGANADADPFGQLTTILPRPQGPTPPAGTSPPAAPDPSQGSQIG